MRAAAARWAGHRGRQPHPHAQGCLHEWEQLASGTMPRGAMTDRCAAVEIPMHANHPVSSACSLTKVLVQRLDFRINAGCGISPHNERPAAWRRQLPLCCCAAELAGSPRCQSMARHSHTVHTRTQGGSTGGRHGAAAAGAAAARQRQVVHRAIGRLHQAAVWVLNILVSRRTCF